MKCNKKNKKAGRNERSIDLRWRAPGFSIGKWISWEPKRRIYIFIDKQSISQARQLKLRIFYVAENMWRVEDAVNFG